MPVYRWAAILNWLIKGLTSAMAKVNLDYVETVNVQKDKRIVLESDIKFAYNY